MTTPQLLLVGGITALYLAFALPAVLRRRRAGEPTPAPVEPRTPFDDVPRGRSVAPHPLESDVPDVPTVPDFPDLPDVPSGSAD